MPSDFDTPCIHCGKELSTRLQEHSVGRITIRHKPDECTRNLLKQLLQLADPRRH